MAAEFVLSKTRNRGYFICLEQESQGRQYAVRIIANIFVNNKRRVSTDQLMGAGWKLLKTTTREDKTLGIGVFTVLVF